MPLIDDLRAHWFTNGCEEYQRRAAAALEKLARYAEHGPNCPCAYHATGDQCLCGLSALLKEIAGG